MGISIEHRELDARQQMPEHRHVAVTLHAGADQGRARRSSFDAWCEPPDRNPGHRRGALGRDRAAIEHRYRQARPGVIEDHHGVDRRDPEGVVRPEPGHPFHADQVVGPVRRGPPQVCGHRVDERTGGTRMHGDLRWELGVANQRGHRPLGEAEPLGEGRHCRQNIGRRQVAERGRGHAVECTRPLG